MRDRVADGLERGLTVAEIASELNIVKSTVCYHARRLGQPADSRFARRYDWSAIQRYYDQGHSIRQCARAFGFCPETWHRAVRVGLLRSRPAAAPIERYLVKGRQVNRHHLKMRLAQQRPQSASLRTLWDRRLARETTFDVPAPRKWGRRRQQAREPSAALPELP
jgi:transposase-like protein